MNMLTNKNLPLCDALSNNNLYLGSNFNNKYLTKRETEILYYVVLGYTAKKIGKILNISHRTVEVYVDCLKSKLNCRSKAEIIGVVLTSDIISKLNILK